jgi:hypothetical protein
MKYAARSAPDRKPRRTARAATPAVESKNRSEAVWE